MMTKKLYKEMSFFSSKLCHGWNEKYPPKNLVLEDLFPDCGLCFEGSGSFRNWRLDGNFAWIFKLFLLFLSSLIVSVTVFWL